MDKKYRISLTKKQISHFEKVYKKFIAKNQNNIENFATAQVFCEIIDYMKKSIEKSDEKVYKNKRKKEFKDFINNTRGTVYSPNFED